MRKGEGFGVSRNSPRFSQNECDFTIGVFMFSRLSKNLNLNKNLEAKYPPKFMSISFKWNTIVIGIIVLPL
jgi:hypothetical protein